MTALKPCKKKVAIEKKKKFMSKLVALKLNYFNKLKKKEPVRKWYMKSIHESGRKLLKKLMNCI